VKFVSYHKEGRIRCGLIAGSDVVEIDVTGADGGSDLGASFAAGLDLVTMGRAAIESRAPSMPLTTLAFAPPVPRPGKIPCLGLNYFDHAKEGGRDKPDYPWFFFRGATSLIAHLEPGIVPRVSPKFDFEAELAVVIGRLVPRHVSQHQALDYVFGYSCFNDMSVRDYQKRTPQWTIGKNFDGTGAFGPLLVTADELPRGAEGLRIQSRLNGQVMQVANTRDMIWGVAETISLLSACLTLEPGDVIAMGTPAGVGQARTPPVWMKAGDTIEVEIEGIGTLSNPIRAEESVR